jgi:hypothetical protein
MKIKYLYLNLFTLLVMSYTNGTDETTRLEEGVKPSGRSMLRASQMTADEDNNDLTEHKGDEIKTASPTVPSFVSAPTTLPSPKGRSPKVRYNHDSFSSPIVKGGTPKSSK